MGTLISSGQFAELLAGEWCEWFKFECQPAYKITAEREPLSRFTEDGTLLPPGEFGWWQDWLDMAAGKTRDGRVMRRVRVIAEPPTVYQRYLLAVDHWHAEAGDRISYMPASAARRLGLPLDADWHLFDNSTLVLTRFTPDGEVREREMITSRGAVLRYTTLRDRALRKAAPASNVAA